jgi:hypothetical protein
VATVQSLPSGLAGFDLSEDLSEVASRAAIELDNLRLNRSNKRSAVERLTRMLNDWLAESGGHALDPTTAVVVHRALSSGQGRVDISTLADLAKETRGLLDRFRSISQAPNPRDLKELLEFCLSLSENASGSKAFGWGAPAQPYSPTE